MRMRGRGFHGYELTESDMSTVSSFEGDVRKPKGAVLFTG